MHRVLRCLCVMSLLSLITVQISYPSSPGRETYRPVYLSFEKLRTAVKSEASRFLKNPGKILVKDHLIFINERFEGVHVFDNSNPRVPKPIAFIRIPGNIDLAMKNNVLYADSYVDLVALDISDPKAVKVTGRLEDIYPNEPFVAEETAWNEDIDQEKGVVVERERVSVAPANTNGSDGIAPGCSRSS